VTPEGTRLSRPGALASAPWEALGTLRAFADERGVTMLYVAIGWLLARPQVASVIAGATRPEQVRANVAAGRTWMPDAADLAAIDEIFPGPA
jgi:aryl-alcohol dehydrogenase-like predicted oxidoreductase